MPDVHATNVVIELCCVALCAIGIVCVRRFRTDSDRHRPLFVMLLYLQLVSALSDALAGACRGVPGVLASLATQGGNRATFCASILLLATFNHYLCMRVAETNEVRLGVWTRFVWVVSALLCALALAGAFFWMDGDNIYHRSSLYWLIPAFGLAIGATDIALVMSHGQHLSRLARASLLFYAIVPSVASIAQIFVYGINYAIIAGFVGLAAVTLETRRDPSEFQGGPTAGPPSS